jgi:hypothetical protein
MILLPNAMIIRDTRPQTNELGKIRSVVSSEASLFSGLLQASYTEKLGAHAEAVS